MKMKEMIPREHGAWAMWIVPMLSAAFVTHFSLSFLFLTACFTLLYVSHHPIVTIAKRSWKWQEGEKGSLALIAVPALLLGAGLVWFYDLPWLLLFGVMESGLFLFSVRTYLSREQRSFFNELTIVAALTLSGPAAYYSVTGALDDTALALYLLNFSFFGSSVFYVKMRIEYLKTKGSWTGPAAEARRMNIVYHSLLVIVLAAAVIVYRPDILLFAGFIPMLVQAAAGLRPKQAKANFNRLGVTLVVQSALFLLAVGLFLRQG